MGSNSEKSKPLISIIVPAYNAENFIEQTIRSVQSQTVNSWELLVIDDCSTDHTYQTVKQLAKVDTRIQLLKNEQNSGPSYSRNRGMDLANGEYVAFLDSDDLWMPEKLEKQIELLERKNADFVCCSYMIIDEQGNRSKKDVVVPETIDLKLLLKNNLMGCSTVLLTRKATENHRFRTDFYHEDYVFWLDLLQDGLKACGCTEVLSQWRYMPHTRSANKWRSAAMRWQVYRKALKFSVLKSTWYFGQYAMYGIKKYMSK